MSFRNYYPNIPQHYSNEEFDALKKSTALLFSCTKSRQWEIQLP